MSDTDPALFQTLQAMSTTLVRISNRLDKMEEAREEKIQELYREALEEMAGLRAANKSLERRVTALERKAGDD